MPLIEDGDSGLYFPGGMLEAEDGLYSAGVETGLTPTYLTWRGLLIAPQSDPNTPFHLSDITGWNTTPSINFDTVTLRGGIGAARTPGRADPRIVTVTGWCYDPDLRNRLLAILTGYAVPSVGTSDTDPLVVTHGGVTLTADAQLIKADATAEIGWGGGRFGFTLQWRCPDPLRYGQQVLYSVGITGSTSGITWPATTPWVFPAAPLSGQLVVSNPGNTLAPAVFSLNGPLSGIGLDVAGRRVTYPFDLAAGDALVIDTAQAATFFNGAYRAPAAGSALAADLRIPQGTSTVQALGAPGPGGTPWMTAAFRPAYW